MTDSVPLLEKLCTRRLLLRAFDNADAAAVQRLAGDFEVARWTLAIPHPYEDGVAEEWIASQRDECEVGRQFNFAVTRRETGELVGAIGLALAAPHERAELGYWIGCPFWGRGYATEAATATAAFAFDALDLHRLHAGVYVGNRASARVLEKLGFRHEGRLRRHARRFGAIHDVDCYGLLREEFSASS